MLLFECEGKEILRDYGIPTPRGVVVGSLEAVPDALASLTPPVMIKAQVLAGGRGKAGGIASGETSADVPRLIGKLLGSSLKGHRVERVLLEEQVQLKGEYYAGVTLEGEGIIVLLGVRGGVDVEASFAMDRGSVEVIRVDPLFGIHEYQVRAALEHLGISAEIWFPFGQIVTQMVRIFREVDATLVEINPLAEAADGKLVALDARVEVDDGALFRQPRLREIQSGRGVESGVMQQLQALEIQYVPMGGEVGLVSSGAGAGVTILDWIDLEGGRPDGFMDLDYAILGGKTEDGLRLALNFLGSKPQVRSILVNFTTCGIRVDLIAEALVKVLDGFGDALRKPVFIHIQGNRGATAHALIRQAGYHLCETLGQAVREACRAAAGDKRA